MSALGLLLKESMDEQNQNQNQNQNKHNYLPLVGGALATLGGVALRRKIMRDKILPKINTQEVAPKVTKGDFSNHLKEVYSKHIPWDNGISVKSAHVAGKKEFAQKLLDNIGNEEEFLKLYNSEHMNPNLKNVKLDKKYDAIEDEYGAPLDLVVDFDKFGIKDGSLTDKTEKVIHSWYKSGVDEVRDRLKYRGVASKDWDRVRRNLQPYLR